MRELFEKGITFEEFVKESEENIAKRIKERYEKTVLDEDLIEKIKFKDEINILAFAESWCPDSQVNVPIVAKIASYNKNFKLRILKREDNEEHMKPYYIDGKAKIPTFVFMNKDFKEIGHWIERPEIVKELAKSGEGEWKRDYLKGKYDKNIIEEIVNILSR
ncbi:thioredoxin family protein [Thermoanaerobacter sp. CM-CNRG TB177]|uniref:thioredoxin family protein n=1 Tax=Thermoanaerobacter sp. CM-CNRG TB177 TaxID=2800659 RepID=UPI001BDF4943|nr:thioredoxin family protein [Thermoanaerobacter sp. CM-CNRG TB177]MBT1278580.1 thioredoxin family protein [Thermoanaerobacter sp. CM-CNRG TB177]